MPILPNIYRPAVLLFDGRGLISKLIKWQTGGQFSHAGFLLPDGRILESWQGAGVRVRSTNDWKGITFCYMPDLTKEQWEAALHFAISQIGKGYDYWAIIRFISRGRMPDNDKWFCSELVFESIAQAGVYPLIRVAPYEVSPEELSRAPMTTELASDASKPIEGLEINLPE